MQSIYVKKYWVFIVLFVLFTVNSYAIRISRPTTFQLPWTDEQVGDLNNVIEQIFLMQQGRYEMDIETTAKSNANNGEAWLVITGNTVRIQFKGDGRVYTVTPDGY